MNNDAWFLRFSNRAAHLAGASWTFILACALILVWAVTGPIFDFSDGWQLTVNTGTTIVTFLMVFLIQNTQNRDAVAMHLKLDELIRTSRKAHNSLLDIEEMSESELEQVRKTFAKLAERARVEGWREQDLPSPSEIKEREAELRRTERKIEAAANATEDHKAAKRQSREAGG